MKSIKNKVAVKSSSSSAKLNRNSERKSHSSKFVLICMAIVRRRRPVLKFAEYTYSALLAFSRNVQLSMDGSLIYVNPPVTILDQTTANDAFQAAIDACGPHVRNGSKGQVQAVRDTQRVVKENLRALSDYVDGIAAGDTSLIIAAGFDPSKSPSPFGILSAATRFRLLVKTTLPGQTPLKWDKVHGSRGYQVFTAGSPSDPFVLAATVTKTYYTATSAPGTLAYYQVVAVGAAGLGTPTSPLAAHSSF